jgi:hypothetical protein
MQPIVITVLFCFSTTTTFADIYKYTDAAGNISFTNTPIEGSVPITSQPFTSNQPKGGEKSSKWSDTPFDQVKMRSNAVVQRGRSGIQNIEIWMKYGKSQPKLQYFDCLRIGVGNSRSSIKPVVPDTEKYRIIEYVCNEF